jgi:endonuclease YncB( thermonuclease family)
MKGKFGRVLGDFVAPDGRMVTEIMIEEGYCVPYFGGSKEELIEMHMKNRDRLISEGKVKLEK